MGRNPYLLLGLVLMLSGATLAPIFYFIVASIPLTALAISFIMLGMVSATLGNARPPISPEAAQMMLKTGMENIASLLEELGLQNKAIYLPSSACDGKPKALIPLNQNEAALSKKLSFPQRLIVRYGPNPQDMGLLITTPGAMSLSDVGIRRGEGIEQIEGALNQILVGILDLANSLSVHFPEGSILVEIAGPKLKYENIWFYRSLGSPLASIVATVVSEALDRAVRIKSEEPTGRRTRIEIEVL